MGRGEECTYLPIMPMQAIEGVVIGEWLTRMGRVDFKGGWAAQIERKISALEEHRGMF